MNQSNLRERQKQFQRQEYVARINRVIDYIDGHIGEELTLERLAGVAAFSPYHFHRIFHAMVGEPLNKFIQRLRLEKAAAKLVGNPKKSITEIALDVGFSGSAPFARAFKDAFGQSASEYRARFIGRHSQNDQTNSKIDQTLGKNGKETVSSGGYGDAMSTINRRELMEKKYKQPLQIEVKDLPVMEVAYVRHIGPYAGNAAMFEQMIEKLFRWAGPRGLIRFPETQMLAVYHDHPAVTDESKLRTSMCITVPPETQPDGEIGRMALPGGQYVMARFELATDEYESAWNHVFGQWLPESGYQPADGPVFEMYLNDPKQHPEGKCIVDICVPVKPL